MSFILFGSLPIITKSTNVLCEDFYCDRDSLFSNSLRRRVQMVYWLVKYLCEEKDWKTFTQMFFFFLKLFVLLFSSTTFLLKTFCYSYCRKKINGTCKKLCLSFLILITSSKGLLWIIRDGTKFKPHFCRTNRPLKHSLIQK